VSVLHHQKKSKSFIQYGSNACWIHTITIKHKYKLDNKDIKNIVKRTPGLIISNTVQDTGVSESFSSSSKRFVLQ